MKLKSVVLRLISILGLTLVILSDSLLVIIIGIVLLGVSLYAFLSNKYKNI